MLQRAQIAGMATGNGSHLVRLPHPGHMTMWEKVPSLERGVTVDWKALEHSQGISHNKGPFSTSEGPGQRGQRWIQLTRISPGVGARVKLPHLRIVDIGEFQHTGIVTADDYLGGSGKVRFIPEPFALLPVVLPRLVPYVGNHHGSRITSAGDGT